MAGWLLCASTLFAIQTDELEIGNDGNYDGTVRVYRDANGEMVFIDNNIASPVTLSELNQGRDVHAQLLGLNADDHPQYLNTARHTSEHTAAYNHALATDPDVAGNTTLGAHLEDAAIHLNRAEAESIAGDWIFTGSPEFRANVYLSNNGATGDQSVRFEDGAADAELLWNDAAAQFEFNRDLRLTNSLAVGAAAPLATIHGEAAQAVLRLSDSDSATATQAQTHVEFYDRNINRAGRIGFPAGDGELLISSESTTTKGIRFTTNDGGLMALTQSGALGIQTENPNGIAEFIGIGEAGALNVSNASANITAGTKLGSIDFRGYDDSANAAGIGAQIAGVADGGGHTADSRDTALVFSTTGGAALVEAMRISSDQRVNIGGDATPDSTFTVGATSQFQIGSNGNITSNATGTQSFAGTLRLANIFPTFQFRDSDNTVDANDMAELLFSNNNLQIAWWDNSLAARVPVLIADLDALRVNVGGDSTPDAMFTVGGTSQFQIDSSGNIASVGDINTASGNLEIDPNEAGAAALRLGNLADGDTIEFNGITDYIASMGDGSDNPAADAPADWLEIKIGGVTRYVPVYN